MDQELIAALTSYELQEFMELADSYDEWYWDSRKNALEDLKARSRLIKALSALGRSENLEEAIERFRQTEDERSGYRSMTDSWEREIKNYLKDVWKKPVFRAVRTDDLDRNNLGIFWTYDPDSAYAHWGDPAKPVSILVANIKEEDIDWDTTVEQYMKPQYTEDEVRLLEGARPELVEVFDNLEDFYLRFP